MRRLAAAILLLGCVAGTARAQELKYEKYQLDNGMTVILHEDHSLPVAAVNVWYRVGSKDEPVKRSGFAHLFEHLMFMGTKRVPGSDFDKLMEAGGGSNNATTSSDRTNYFSTGPARLLPTLLWLDADRLEDLGHFMDQKKLDRQRDVVRNERRQSDENRPYGKAELILEGLAYPESHPYHLPVIGSHEDLEAAQVQDVKDFFSNYYVPNNASLVVAGDFDKAKTKELIAKLFGTIPRGADPSHKTAAPAKLDRVIRATTVDKVQHAKIAIAYHSPGLFQDGDAECDLASSALASGNTSRLYKRLVYDEKLAVSVSVSQQSAQLGSLFRVDVLVQPEADLAHVEKLIDEELARFAAEGPTDSELARGKASVELGALERLEGIEAKADKLNEYEYYFGEPNSAKRDLDRYRNATKETVRDWARKVLDKNARVILRVLPEDSAGAPSPRDERPKDGDRSGFTPPAPVDFALSSKVGVSLWQRDELPLVSLRLVFDRDPSLDPEGKLAGLDALTAELSHEGAGDLDALAFGDALQALGAELDVSALREGTTLSLTVLERNLARAAELASWVVRKPRLEAKDFERVKRLHLEHLAEEDDDPATVAARVGQRLLFAKGRRSLPVDGTPETVEPITLEDVKKAHGVLFNPAHFRIHVVGPINREKAQALLEKLFADWKASDAKPFNDVPVAFPAQDRMRVIIVERAEAVQTVVHLLAPGVRMGDERRLPLRVLNTILGGCFTSRLNANLREAHGYTYGAGSRYGMDRTSGTFGASSCVKADVTGAALKEFLAELEKIRTGDVTDDEIVKARESIRTDIVSSFAGQKGILGTAGELALGGLPFDNVARDLAALEKVTAADVNKLAKDNVPLEKAVLVLVGDRKLIEEQIKDLKLPAPVVVDARGNPAGK